MWEGACGGAGAGAAWPWSRPAILLPPPLGPLRGHLLQEARRMWLPSCLPLWPQSPSSGATVGEPPERCGLRGWAGGDALLWSSVARALPQAIETRCPGSCQASSLLPTVSPHTASPPLCIPAPGRQLVTSLHPQHSASSRLPGKCSSPRYTPLETP